MKYLTKLECFTQSKTYIKTYETHDANKPEIGDWAIVHVSPNMDDELDVFLKKNIGKIVNIGNEIESTNIQNSWWSPSEYYVLNYDTEIPKEIDIWFHNNNISFYTNEIKYWSKNKEDLEAIITADKYNL